MQSQSGHARNGTHDRSEATSPCRLPLAPTVLLVAVNLTCSCKWVVPIRNIAPSAVLKLGKPTTELSKGQFCVSLDGFQSHDVAGEDADDEENKLDAYIWDFGDGSPIATLTAPSAASSPLDRTCYPTDCSGTCGDAPQHLYNMPVGSVVLARLQVRDKDRVLSEPAILRISLRTNRPPIARFLVVAGPSSNTVSLDASASSDPDPEDTDRLHFFWDFDDGSCHPPTGISCPPRPTPELCGTTANSDRQKILEHRYSAPGKYQVSLHVSDGELCSGPAYQDIAVVAK